MYKNLPHWYKRYPIYPRIDEKWWPNINFIGNFENLSSDTEKFLRSVHSEDGVSAWERYGKTGWSHDPRGCKEIGDQPFLGAKAKDSKHNTDAKSKFLEYYTPELEIIVEEKYKADLNNNYFKFSPLQLYPH